MQKNCHPQPLNGLPCMTQMDLLKNLFHLQCCLIITFLISIFHTYDFIAVILAVLSLDWKTLGLFGLSSGR